MGRTLQDNANIFIYSSPPYAAAQEERAGDWWEARRFGGDRCRCRKEAAMLWAADGENLDCTEIRKKSVLVSKVFGFGV